MEHALRGRFARVMLAAVMVMGLWPGMAFAGTDPLQQDALPQAQEEQASLQQPEPAGADEAPLPSEGEGQDQLPSSAVDVPSEEGVPPEAQEALSGPADPVEGPAEDETIMPTSVNGAEVLASVQFDQMYAHVRARGGVFNVARSVMIPVWSAVGGQDDIIWYPAQKRGTEWVLAVPIPNHCATGRYEAHAYASVNGAQVFGGSTAFSVDGPTASASITQTADQVARGVFSVNVSQIYSPSGARVVQAPTWSVAQGQDDIEWYTVVPGANGVWSAEVPCVGGRRSPGEYLTHIYITTGNGIRGCIASASGTAELGKAEVLASLQADQRYAHIRARGGAFAGAQQVWFPAWSEAGGQDDIQWYPAVKQGTEWALALPIANHRTAGRYQVHAYAVVNGAQVLGGTSSFMVSAPSGKAELASVGNGCYQIRVWDASSPSGIASISAPTWTEAGGQDDLKWHSFSMAQSGNSQVVTIQSGEHGAEEGRYITHVYLVAQNGVQVLIGVVGANVASKNYVYVTGGLGSGARKVGIKNPSSPGAVQFPVWSENGGQDDIVWYSATNAGNGHWFANVNCYKLKHAGSINVHAYAGGVAVASTSFVVSEDDLLPAKYRVMDSRVAGLGSPTNWLLAVDTANCFVGVYHWDNGGWNNWYRLACSPGKPSTPTVKGVFHVQSRGYSFGSGYTCYYWTQFYGDYLFHSILYDQGTFNVQDGRLGQQLSHGCVRMSYEDARWIHDVIPSGTTVYVY